MKGLGHWVATLPLAAGLVFLQPSLATQTSPAKNAGISDLMAAVKAGDGARISSLLHAGANPNGRDADGMTALMVASSEGNQTAVVLLVAAGADVNAKDGAGLTPLHDAAISGSREVADALLASGADARAVSQGGLTPADEASRNHHQALADYLRSRAASPPLPQRSGQSRTYTNDDLDAVRRTSRLANEGQLAKSSPAGPILAAPGASGSDPAPDVSDRGQGAPDQGTRELIKRAFDNGDWNDNIEGSQRYSKETRHPILALFTGSDWCYFCKQLEANVLSTSAFREAVRGKYILLYVDFPRKKTVPKGVLGERTHLAQKYSVTAFPTLVVLRNGDQYLDRISGFKSGVTAETYISQIEDIAP